MRKYTMTLTSIQWGMHRRRMNQESPIANIEGYVLCLGFSCKSGDCIQVHFVNDLMPDCPGFQSEDEQHSLNIKYNKASYSCRKPASITCFPKHSRCFEIYQLCLYDSDGFGNLAYCRNAAHLRDCSWVGCTNTYKCMQSYCIPYRKLCDGVEDCVEGDDEKNCINYTCPGLLRCSGVSYCVHPTEVCDGITHCPDGDDEYVCDVKACPFGCDCLGYSAQCRDETIPYIPYIETANMKFLSLGYPSMHKPNLQNISAQSNLLILDMSNSVVMDVCPTLSEDFKLYHSIIVLRLQYNYITHVSNRCFVRLLVLTTLELHGNPLKSLSDGAFENIPLLYMSIGQSTLSALSENWLKDLNILQGIDIHGLRLQYISGSSLHTLYNLNYVNSDDYRLCCMMLNTNMCSSKKHTENSCRMVLPMRALGTGISAMASIIFPWDVLLIVRIFTKLYSKRPTYFTIVIFMLLGEVFITKYVLILAVADMYYGNQYILVGTSWVNSIICHWASISISTGMSMSVIGDALLTHLSYMAVMSMVFVEDDYRLIISRIVFSLYPIILCTFTTLLLAESWMNKTKDIRNTFCTILNPSYPTSIANLIGRSILSIILVTSALHVFTTNIMILIRVFRSGKQSQMGVTNKEFHRRRVFSVLKNIFMAIVFKCLHCLPLLSIFLLQELSVIVPRGVELLAICLMWIIGSLRNSFVYVLKMHKWETTKYTLSYWSEINDINIKLKLKNCIVRMHFNEQCSIDHIWSYRKCQDYVYVKWEYYVKNKAVFETCK